MGTLYFYGCMHHQKQTIIWCLEIFMTDSNSPEQSMPLPFLLQLVVNRAHLHGCMVLRHWLSIIITAYGVLQYKNLYEWRLMQKTIALAYLPSEVTIELHIYTYGSTCCQLISKLNAASPWLEVFVLPLPDHSGCSGCDISRTRSWTRTEITSHAHPYWVRYNDQHTFILMQLPFFLHHYRF